MEIRQSLKAWLKTNNAALSKTAIKIRKIADVDKAHKQKEEIKKRMYLERRGKGSATGGLTLEDSVENFLQNVCV